MNVICMFSSLLTIAQMLQKQRYTLISFYANIFNPFKDGTNEFITFTRPVQPIELDLFGPFDYMSTQSQVSEIKIKKRE